MSGRLTIDGFEIHDGSGCYVIAEVGHNHQGSLEQAKAMLTMAKDCGANAVKLQKRSNRTLYTREFFEQPYDNEFSFGPTYGEHREALELGHDDYVVASGESHSVRELAQCAFAYVGLDWQQHVRVDRALQRGAAELRRLIGNPAKARAQLGWEAEVDFTRLVHLLVDADLERLHVRADKAATTMERP